MNYGNHRDYLRDYLRTKKSAVGLRTLARKAGFKSPGHITMLINGQRRLTMRSAEQLAQTMGLRGRRRNLLLAFARLDLAKDESERVKIHEEILKLKSYSPEFQMNAKQYSFLATWYQPVLYALLHTDECPQEPAQLARRLGRGLTASDVEAALADLESLKLIARDGERWKPVNTALTTPEDIQAMAVNRYHANSVKLAGEALALPPKEREFNGLTLTIPPRLMPEVKEKIRRLRVELNELLGSDTEAAEVYQINLQVFPVTQGLEKRKS